MNVFKFVFDVYEELDLDLGEVKICDGDYGKIFCVNIFLVYLVFLKNKMKVVFILGSDINFCDVIDNERFFEEFSLGRGIIIVVMCFMNMVFGCGCCEMMFRI